MQTTTCVEKWRSASKLGIGVVVEELISLLDLFVFVKDI
jgi:hypothetical protein